MKTPPKCPKCRQLLDGPRELPDGLPGVKYRVCAGCGYTQPVTRRPRREKLSEPRS
jgi:ribosomal protein S12